MPRNAQRHQARIDLLTPVLKGWCTELGVEIASLGIQVFGGMGYVEETGAAQYLRDARIATIYEGTTGIQAGDLVGRKLTMDNGPTMAALIGEMRAVEGQLGSSDNVDFPAIRENFAIGIQALEQATQWMLQTTGQDPNTALGASVNYMMLTRLADGARCSRRPCTAGGGR